MRDELMRDEPGRYRDLTTQLIEAFDAAQGRPATPSEASSGRLYADLFAQTLQARLGASEWSRFGAVVAQREAALQDAREGRLTRSERRFAELRTSQEQAGLSETARLLVDVFLCAGEAYLQFRLARYDDAKRLLLHASTTDHRLAVDHDLALMSAHRLQLAHNLLRVYGRQGAAHAAVELAAAFFDHLERRSDDIPAELASPRHLLDSVPEAIPAHYFDRIASEVALLLAGRSDAETADLFRPLAGHAGDDECGDTEWGREAHDWLRCKRLALDGEVEQFLETAAAVIGAGRRSEPLLWFATIIDVIGVCRGQGEPLRQLGERLAAQAAALPDAPYVLRNLTVAA